MAEERKRPVRVAERIREELERLLLRGAVHDPGVQGATVSGVSVSPDLSVADVRVRIYNREVDEPQRKRVVRAFDRAKGLLRRELASRLGMRHTPDLRFHWDSGVDHALRIIGYPRNRRALVKQLDVDPRSCRAGAVAQQTVE